MSGKKNAKSPHKAYALMHKEGTVRSGKWKFYPWREKKGGKGNDAPVGREPSPLPVQLYDTRSDVTESKNLADKYPEIVANLQGIWKKHIAEIEANARPTAVMIRPKGSISPERPGGAKVKKKKKRRPKK